MKIEVDKKYFIVIMATLLVLAGAFFVVSYVNLSTGVGHSIEEVEGTVASGFCVFSYNIETCPSGWSMNSTFGDKTIRSVNPASANLAVDGGIGGYDEIPMACGGDCGSQGGVINHGYIFDNWPPYANVLVCCKD